MDSMAGVSGIEIVAPWTAGTDSLTYAPVAQLDRVPGYEPGGREFESLRARHLSNTYDTSDATSVSDVPESVRT